MILRRLPRVFSGLGRSSRGSVALMMAILAEIDGLLLVPTTNVAAQANADAGQWTSPTAATCAAVFTNVSDNYDKGYSSALVPGTSSGTTTIGRDGSTDAFAPGTYIFTGNVTITRTNNSAAPLSAPPLSPATSISGLLFWQACSRTATSRSNINGAIYAPFGSLQLSNAAQIVAAPLSSLSGVASSVSAIGSASLQLLLTTGSGSSSQVSLLQ